MNEGETLSLLSEIKRQINLHEVQMLRLEGEIKRMEFLRQGILSGRHFRLPKTLSVSAPEVNTSICGSRFKLPPKNLNGKTTMVDAIRLSLLELPDVINLDDVRREIIARFSHLNTKTDSFVRTWQYVRLKEPRIIKIGHSNRYQKVKVESE